MSPIATTHFMNVDLDLYSRRDLQPLVEAFEKKVFVLYAGRVKRTYCAHLELARNPRNADYAIRAFCALVEALPRQTRDLWNNAKTRDFSVGVQAGARPNPADFVLAAETLKAVSRLHARVVFTIYPDDAGAAHLNSR